MEIGLGVLGWTPDVFWGATLREFLNAKEGWLIAQGNGTPPSPGPSKSVARELVGFMAEMKERGH